MNTENKNVVDRFTAKDNALMLNSILQMIPVVLISAFLMFFTHNDYIWTYSALSLCSSLTVLILSEASYESDYEHYGSYEGVSKIYNTLALSSCFCLLGAIITYFRESWIMYPDRMVSSILIIFLVFCYLLNFLYRK